MARISKDLAKERLIANIITSPTPTESNNISSIKKKVRSVSSITPPPPTPDQIKYIQSFGSDEETLFEFKRNNERIITPADDELPSILGKYEESSENELPPALENWLQDYDQEINWYQYTGKDLNLDVGGAVSSLDDMATIGALVNCKWNQKAPYNLDTVFNGNTCVTGCGATAIAQILYYWGCQPHNKKYYRRGCTATQSYTSKTNKYKIAALPSIPIFDYNNMCAGKPSTDKQKKSIAEMMLYCGCAVKSDYAQGVTTSYLQDLQKGLRDCLRMGNPTIIQASKGATAFERSILAELKEGRPVLLIGSGSQGGHFFLCDGYNPKENLYHFNWGWGGSYDGWFAMSALNPSHYTFNANKKAIINIQPQYVWGDVNGDGSLSVSDIMSIQSQILGSSKKTEQADLNNDGDVNVTDLMLGVNKILGK